MEQVRREDCLDLLHAGEGLTDVVKVVTGMRRAGKSTLLEQYMDDLRGKGVSEQDIVYINLESFGTKNLDEKGLDGLLLERIGESGTRYVFLDEIQNVDGWERSISSLINTKRCDIYITGSNSKLLSSELATHIAGRYVEVKVLPLSFAEYMELHPGDREARFAEFLRWGGLPEVDPDRGERFTEAQLTGIFNTVLVRDVLSRLGSSDASTLLKIARFVYSNIGNETSVDEIARTLKVSNGTVDRYLDKMEEAFLIYRAERYDIVGKKLLKTRGKVYASDLGLRNNALGSARGTDVSRPLENVVYLELLRRGYTVSVGSYRDWEIDFTAMRGDETEYIQVCQTMLSEATREREVRSLRSIRSDHRKTVLTMDRLGLGNEDGIRIVNVLDWLLEDRKRDRTPRQDWSVWVIMPRASP